MQRSALAAWVAQRDLLTAALLLPAAVVLGLAAAGSPKLALAAFAAAAVLALALTAPLTVVVCLLALTAVLPYNFQSHYALYAGGLPGLLPSDALLLGGMIRTALVIPHMRLDRARQLVVLAIAAFVAIALVDCALGLRNGRDVSVVGAEFRHLAGFAALLMAIPLMEDPRSRGRLLGWLLALGLALGLWGLAQWWLGTPFGGIGDIGVRQGVGLTSAGRGQLQGGMFCFPVAVIVATAALLSGAVRARGTYAAIVLVLVVNALALLFTFERTLWLATAAALIFLLARAGSRVRRRALLWGPLALTIMLGTVQLTAPGTLATAQQRLGSVANFSSDTSLRYRHIESEHVLAQIHAHPLTGSALGASILWGLPFAWAKPNDRTYTHNGYLWLAWKVGIPAAVVLVGLMLAGALWRGPPAAEPLFVAVRHGAQASLLAYLLIAYTFPIFNALSTSVLIGLLLALAAMPKRRSIPGRSRL
jgi:hypothetical protein